MSTERKKGRHHTTPFQQRWGIHANDLAEQENVLPATIHMRVRNFGSPWQRKAHPTFSETITGRTLGDWAEKLDLHPNSVLERLRKHGDPTYENPSEYAVTLRGVRRAEVNWRDRGEFDSREWLMPQHPDYAEWKSRYTKWENLP